jgi:uncharacterized Zn finger protein
MTMRLLKKLKYNDEELFMVEGASSIHVVRHVGNEYVCSCPSYQYRKSCKHVEFIRGGLNG